MDICLNELFNTSFNFFRSTNVPSVSVQAEYMVLDALGVGGFVGLLGSTNNNKNTSGVSSENEIFGTVFGGFVSYVSPIENWLYSGIELNGSYETGVLKVRDSTNKKEDYNFNRLSVGLNLSAVLAPTERIQISIGGVGVGYNSFLFTGSGLSPQTSVDNDDPTTINEFNDSEVKGSEFGLQAIPKIAVLFTVFSPGGR